MHIPYARRYDVLFGLLLHGGHLTEAIWRLLMRLPTAPATLVALELVGAPAPPSWGSVLPPRDRFRLLYGMQVCSLMAVCIPVGAPVWARACQVVESFIEAHEDLAGGAADSAHQAAWRRQFVQLGGAEHLKGVLMDWDAAAESGVVGAADGAVVRLERTCLALIVRTLRFFLLGALAIARPGVVVSGALVRQRSTSAMPARSLSMDISAAAEALRAAGGGGAETAADVRDPAADTDEPVGGGGAAALDALASDLAGGTSVSDALLAHFDLRALQARARAMRYEFPCALRCE